MDNHIRLWQILTIILDMLMKNLVITINLYNTFILVQLQKYNFMVNHILLLQIFIIISVLFLIVLVYITNLYNIIKSVLK
jgi:hypothetical protein